VDAKWILLRFWVELNSNSEESNGPLSSRSPDHAFNIAIQVDPPAPESQPSVDRLWDDGHSPGNTPPFLPESSARISIEDLQHPQPRIIPTTDDMLPHSWNRVTRRKFHPLLKSRESSSFDGNKSTSTSRINRGIPVEPNMASSTRSCWCQRNKNGARLKRFGQVIDRALSDDPDRPR